jgi:hypothetical protein
MFKNILIFCIIFALILLIVFGDNLYLLKNDFTSSVNIDENFSNINEQFSNIDEQFSNIDEQFGNLILNENNFTMSDNSIIMSQNTNLSKDECLNKVNKSDIKGASYNLSNNTCTLYFFAEKGLSNKNFESKILNQKF